MSTIFTKFHFRGKLIASISAFVLFTVSSYGFSQAESDFIPSGVSGKSAAASVQLPDSDITPEKKEHKVFFGYLRLVGTMISERNSRRNKAVIEDRLTFRQKSYPIGTVIPYGAEIIRIEQKGIVLEKEGARRRLALAEKLGNSDDIAVLRGSGYKRVTENEWLIRPNRLIKSAETIYELLKQVSIGPNISAGGIEGFRVNEMEPGALINKLGLKEGDVISSVNGETIDSLAKAYEIYQQIRKNPVIRIGLNRGQQEMALAYYMIPDGPPKYSVKQVLQSANMAGLFDRAHP